VPAANHNDRGRQLAALEQRLRQALVLRGQDGGLHAELGRVLEAQLRHRPAAAQFEQALKLNPADARVLSDLARTLLGLHRVEEALPWFEQAVAKAPGSAELHAMLGGLLHGLGRTQEAIAALERALALAPQSARYYASLAEMRPLAEAEAAALEALLRTVSRREEAAEIHFTLGRYHESNGAPENAFKHQLLANRLQRQGFVYDEAAMLGQIEALKRVFTKEWMPARADCGDPSDLPVFVVGMPRSGTTLVEQILASHPEAAGIGEDRAFGNLVLAEGLPYPAGVPELSRKQLKHIGAGYVEAVRPAGARRVVDKMPVNFLFAGLIHLVLPQARIIHVVRNAVDTCLSCFALKLGPAYPYVYDFGELGRYYRAYRGLMAHWQSLLPEDVLIEVQYENLVARPEAEARRLIEHIGLGWNASCLDFHNNRRAVFTASAAQVRQPLYRRERWHPDAASLAPLREALGPYAGA